jgi:hypothetical protein
MSLVPSITATPGNPPTYNPNIAETFSWIPVNTSQRTLFAKAVYSVDTPNQNGFVLTADTSTIVGNFCAIKMITNTTFTGITADNSSLPTLAVTFPANFVLEGPITAYKLATGAVIASKA